MAEPLPQDVWALRLPQIERIARHWASMLGARPLVADEFIGGAAAVIFEKTADFDPAKAGFATWCSTVLRNRCVDMIRRDATRRGRHERYQVELAAACGRDLLAPQPPSPSEVAEETAEREARRPRFNLAAAFEEHLVDPMDRVLVATDIGVLDDSDRAITTEWIRAAGWADYEQELRAINKLPKRDRRKAMAAAIGQKYGWVRQRIYRATLVLRRALGEETDPCV